MQSLDEIFLPKERQNLADSNTKRLCVDSMTTLQWQVGVPSVI